MLFFVNLLKSPYLGAFLRGSGDFIGNLFGGKLDVVHESLLGLVAADVHHLEHGVAVAEIHIGYAGATGGMRGDAGIARHDDVAVEVGFRLLARFLQRLLLLLREVGGHQINITLNAKKARIDNTRFQSVPVNFGL